MTIKNYLKQIEIRNHADSARYPDGSGGKDDYLLVVMMNGHGNVLDAKVKKTSIIKGMMCIEAEGRHDE